MHFLPDVLVTCGECEGRRFSGSALQIRWRGLNVVDILRLSVQEAAAIFHDLKKVAFPLRLLEEAGLGYLSLGQPAPTLSGGEAQRLKLVSRIARSAEARGRLLLLDEPTAGLHLKDLASLVALLRRLVREGDTVVCVEHHLGMIAAADWIIDLGPGAGPRGGLLIAEGPPEAVAASEGPTGLSLRAYVPGPRP
jgi:excinuclease ABC subunit A